MRCDEDTGANTCQPLARERIRYFTGRHMTARDFTDGDAYHRSFRYLHNRVLHGWGVACGLSVEPHPKPECRGRHVLVRCGLALDCCGREIVVPRDVVTSPIDWDARQKQGDDVLLLALEYCETLVEKVPVLYSQEACSAPAMEFGRVREGYQLSWHWVARDKLADWGWVSPAECDPEGGKAWTDEDERKRACHEEREHCCVEPECPEPHVVPLAVIDASGPEAFGDAPESIDTSGRRAVVQARERLTHICGLNWPHGGLVKRSQLHALKVRFDRPLLPAEHPEWPGPRGVNERTFVVQYGEQIDGAQVEDLDFVEFTRPPYLGADGRTAIYEIHKPATYRSHIIHVTLRCDFILDCRRQPVDGNHLGGELPTGDGIAGGTFESWFRVVDDEEYDRLMQGSDASATGGAKESQ